MSDVPGTTHAAAASLYGLAAEYEHADQVVDASRAAREAGYTKMDAYTPHPIDGLDEALGVPPSRMGWVVLAAGLFGAMAGYGLQYFGMVIFYPLNIGGRPLNDWPAYIVITFEVTVLMSAFTAGLFMLARNGLPRPYNSIFNAPGFERASRDRYFLCIEAVDARFDPSGTRTFLEGTPAVRVTEVER